MINEKKILEEKKIIIIHNNFTKNMFQKGSNEVNLKRFFVVDTFAYHSSQEFKIS